MIELIDETLHMTNIEIVHFLKSKDGLRKKWLHVDVIVNFYASLGSNRKELKKKSRYIVTKQILIHIFI